MVGELISFPVRVGWRVSRVVVRGGVQMSGRAMSLAASVVKTAVPGGTPSSAPARPTAEHEAPPSDSTRERAGSEGAREQRDREPQGDPRASAAARAAQASASEPQEVTEARAEQATEAARREPEIDFDAEAAPLLGDTGHVSEEPTVVAELAEPGAEDGAGAEIRVAEPWDGYDQMDAKEVIDRLAGATDAELAAAQLYESSKRARETVMTAVERALRSKSGRAAAINQTRKEPPTNGG